MTPFPNLGVHLETRACGSGVLSTKDGLPSFSVPSGSLPQKQTVTWGYSQHLGQQAFATPTASRRAQGTPVFLPLQPFGGWTSLSSYAGNHRELSLLHTPEHFSILTTQDTLSLFLKEGKMVLRPFSTTVRLAEGPGTQQIKVHRWARLKRKVLSRIPFISHWRTPRLPAVGGSMPGDSSVVTPGCLHAGPHALRPSPAPIPSLSRTQSLPGEDELTTAALPLRVRPPHPLGVLILTNRDFSYHPSSPGRSKSDGPLPCPA